MKRMVPWILALAAGLTLPAHARTAGSAAGRIPTLGNIILAQNPEAPGKVVEAQTVPKLAEGTPVVLVGEVTSPPKTIVSENKTQVAIGPARMDYTLHLSDATIYDEHGAVLKPDRLSDKIWVRAEGTVMNDPRRVKVTQLQVIGKDPSTVRQSAFYRPGLENGYIMAIAGARETYPPVTGVVVTPPPMVIVGQVVDDTGPLEASRTIRVKAAGNNWALEVPKDTPVFDVSGKKISVHNVAKGQWVRVHGWQTGDLRVRPARIQEIGPDEAYRTSSFYRTGEPLGYVERTPGTEVRFNPIRVTGIVTAVDQNAGTVKLRDEAGQERVFPLATVTVRADGNEVVDVTKLQSGQKVTVEGSEIAF